MDAIEAELTSRLGELAVSQLKKILFSDWGPIVSPEKQSGGFKVRASRGR